jgi:hypothetical protein
MPGLEIVQRKCTTHQIVRGLVDETGLVTGAERKQEFIGRLQQPMPAGRSKSNQLDDLVADPVQAENERSENLEKQVNRR